MSEGKVQQKQQARRAEIVVAAQKCFAEKGLHGASVADIAREAGLSVGQLYRIFASKEAIIEAIVSEIVNARVGEMIDENHNLARKAAVLAGRIPTSAATKSDNYLLMEINAEASRNPRLREILMQADRRLKEEGGRLSQRYHPGLSDARRNAASELIAVLTEGAAYRCELSASTPVDKADLEALYNMIFDRLFDEQAYYGTPGVPHRLVVSWPRLGFWPVCSSVYRRTGNAAAECAGEFHTGSGQYPPQKPTRQ